MKGCLFLFAILPLLLPGAASAQIDDYDFARGLADRSYFELATDILNSLINDSSLSEQERSIARLGLVGVLKRDADRETDADTKLAKYREAERGYEEFVDAAENQDHPKLFDALFEFGELLQSKGEAISRMIQQAAGAGKDAPKIADLRDEGTRAIEKAQEILQRAADYLEEIPEDQRTDAQRNDYLKARYYKAVNFYFIAELQHSGTFEKENNLKLAADALENFAWEFENYKAGWLALLYVAKAYGDWAHENVERQAEYAGNAINYLEGIIARGESDKSILEDPWFSNLIQRAFFEGASIYNSLGRFPETVEFVKRMPEVLVRENGAAVELGQWGFLARLEEVKAYEQIQDLTTAVAVCTEIAKKAEKIPGVGAMIARKLAGLIEKQETSGTKGIVIPPEVLYQMARGFYLQKDWFRAVEFFQRVLGSIEETGTRKELAPEAWNYIGKSLSRVKFHIGAGLAYETGAADYKDTGDADLVEDNYFRAYSAVGRQAKIEASSKDGTSKLVRQWRDRIRKTLTELYPGTDLVYYEGLEKMEEKDFEGAVRDFEKVEKSSEILYPRARAKIAECHLAVITSSIEAGAGTVGRKARRYLQKIASLDSSFREFCEDPNWQTGNTQALDERAQARAALVYFAAKASAAVGDADAALKLLDGFPTVFEKQESFVDAALSLQVQLLLKKGDLAGAEGATAELNSRFPDSASTSGAYLRIGQAYKQSFRTAAAAFARSNGIEEAKAEDAYLRQNEGARATLIKSADFVAIWWGKQKKPFDKGLEIGRDYFRLEAYDKALGILAFLYERDGKNPKISAKQRSSLKFLLAEAYLRLHRYKEAAPLYAELYKTYIGDRKGVVNPDLRRNYAIALGGTVVVDDKGQVTEYEGIEDFAGAQKIWRPIVVSRSDKIQFQPIWWEAKFHYAYMDYKLGHADRAKAFLRNLEVMHPEEMQESAVYPEFQWLKSKL